MKQGTPVIGLTGGIGTGKSTAAEMLKANGFLHIDADQIGRDLTKKESSMLKKLNDVFGPNGEMGDSSIEILDDKGELKRKTLASIVFSDNRKKEKLDELMFDSIIEIVDKKIADMSQENAKGIILDAPLLFEAGLDSRCDMVLLLVAQKAIRINRVCTRDGVLAEDVENRINNQMGDDEKRKKADYIIDNSGSVSMLDKEIKIFLQNFQKILAKK